MKTQTFLWRRFFVFGTLFILLTVAAIIFCTNPEGRFRWQVFLLGLRHGAINRNEGMTSLSPSFDEDDRHMLLWKTAEWRPKFVDPIHPPNPYSASDAQLILHMASMPPPMQYTDLRIFQSGYLLGWNWRLCLTGFAVLACIGLSYRLLISVKRKNKALQALDGTKIESP